MRLVVLFIVAALSMLDAMAVAAASIVSQDNACATLKDQIAMTGQIASPASEWGCEFIEESRIPSGFYLVALRGTCHEDICGSTLIGWYAIRMENGQVSKWDIGEWKLGERIGPLP